MLGLSKTPAHLLNTRLAEAVVRKQRFEQKKKIFCSKNSYSNADSRTSKTSRVASQWFCFRTA